MLRNVLPLTALLSASAVLPAHAQNPTFQQQLSFAGDIPPGCLMDAPSVEAALNATAANAASGTADIVVTRLVGDDGVPIGAQVVLTLQSACNQSHALTLSSLNGALVNADGNGSSTAFRTALPYDVSIAWAGSLSAFNSEATSLTAAIGSAARGPLTVSITIPAGGPPLEAGPYSDQLVLELAAAS